MAAGHFLARKVSSLGGGGSRGMLPRKILKFDVAKTAFYAFLMLRASRFSSPGILKNRSYSGHLPETITEDEHFRACSFCTYSGLGIQTEVRIRVPFG